MSYTFFQGPNNINEISFIAGSHQEMIFAVYDSDGNPISLTGASRKRWYLSPFGDATALVTVDGVSGSATNIVRFIITGSSTGDLNGGKYIQQYEIIDSSGSSFLPSQGLVNVFSKRD